MAKPLISVVLPVYNGEAYLKAAIESVLQQTYNNYELIIVNDGSEDNSAVISNSFSEVRYFYQPNQGVAAARNLGIAQATGDYLAFIDADDLWHEEKLADQIAFMETDPAMGYSFTRHHLFHGPEMEDFPDWIRINYAQNDLTGYIPSSLVARRWVFDRVGLFDTDYRLGEDSDWFLRAKDAGIPMGILEQTLLFKRIHSGNISAQVAQGQQYLLRAFKASVLRKKQMGRKKTDEGV